jgi:PAS domain S-box-containing protein
MLDAKGTYRGRIWYYRDITEPTHLRKQLEEAAQEWRSTFDSVDDQISIHDKDNRFIRVNKSFAEKRQMNITEIPGKSCAELLHSQKEAPPGCPWRQSMETGKPNVVEVYLPDESKWIQESASPIFGDHGDLIGTVNIVKDITQLKQIERRLELNDRMASIGELVSGIAHELNNPLTSVIGIAKLLQEKDINNDIKEDLDIVSSEAERAARIVKNLLSFARKHTPEKQLSQMNNIIEDVLLLRSYELKVNNIKVIKHLDPSLPQIKADYFQMQQVILNVVVNAEYFMKKANNQGVLTIRTEKVGSMIRISIADDGPGITVNDLPRIFDPFFTTKEVGQGTGLGLSICHGIVTEHGGNMYALSDYGKGATFVIELPISG